MNPWYNAGDHRREIYDSLPLNTFMRIDDMRAFEILHITVISKVRNSVPTIHLEDSILAELPFGSLRAIKCAGLLMAYKFVMPRCQHVRVGQNFAAFQRKPEVSPDTQTIFVDRHFAVIGNADALLSFNTTTRWTSRDDRK